MLKRLTATWDGVRTSLWLVPAVMVLLGVGLAVAMLRMDVGHGSEDQVRVWWINSGAGEDARNLLSTLPSAIITMASMAFSVTVVALTLAANAYGSRLIRAAGQRDVPEVADREDIEQSYRRAMAACETAFVGLGGRIDQTGRSAGAAHGKP
ncbi:DUF2254 family protein [Microvirga makkahensis]|uniref:DUF2254 domain-containing protein n=1 Tax=Microvirga makkahensis TaxID=1128670 RepID=A0A7X3SRD2_9HYPH|nr:DUF2254 family protein [Microvirga makkahensis]MXQ14223.1 DUF2254 domain-containing protein [Microvirga makkahensis]